MLSSISFGAVLDRLMRPDDHVLAFAHVAAAHILIDKDELLAREQFGRSQVGSILVDAIGRDAVAGALHHDGIRPVVGEDVLRNVNGGEQLHAVAHGDAVFELGVVLADELPAGSRSGSRRGRSRRGYRRRCVTPLPLHHSGPQKKKSEKNTRSPWHPGIVR